MKRRYAGSLLVLILSLSACGPRDAAAPPAPAEVPQPGTGLLTPEEAGPAPQGQSEEGGQSEEVMEPTSNATLAPGAPGAGAFGGTPVAAGAVAAQVMTWEQSEEFVRAQQGKVVVMDLWTTYCAPCRKEFPNLVALHQRLGGKITCVSISLDFDGLADYPVEKCQADALAFLTEQQATFTNVVCSTPAEEVFGKKIPHQSVPAVYVFNQRGELVGQFPNLQAANPDEFSYATDIAPLVEKLLSGAGQ